MIFLTGMMRDSFRGPLEYTCSEVELSNDEVQNKKSKTVKASSVQKDKIYQCDNCENSYSSVLGLCGHLQKKQGITNVKGLIYFLSALFSQVTVFMTVLQLGFQKGRVLEQKGHIAKTNKSCRMTA